VSKEQVLGSQYDLDDELLAQAEASGYSPGAHTEQDQVRGKGKHGGK